MTYRRLTQAEAEGVFDLLVEWVGVAEKLRSQFVFYWTRPRGGASFKFSSSFSASSPRLTFSAHDLRVTAGDLTPLDDEQYSHITECSWRISQLFRDSEPLALLPTVRERLSALAERSTQSAATARSRELVSC